jgi:hypothetical protein
MAVPTLEEVLRIVRAHEPELRAQHVRSLSVFGSVARGAAREDSDIDLLVEFDARVGILAFVGLQQHLERLLGRRVDLVTRGGLKECMRAEVLREAVRAA